MTPSQQKRENNCSRNLHEYAHPTIWLDLDGKMKIGNFCRNCGKWNTKDVK